jgi:repressor LexA
VREIGSAHGITSPNGVICHLRALAKKGLIEHDRLKSRGIRLVGEGSKPLICPHCGKPIVT